MASNCNVLSPFVNVLAQNTKSLTPSVPKSLQRIIKLEKSYDRQEETTVVSTNELLYQFAFFTLDYP